MSGVFWENYQRLILWEMSGGFSDGNVWGKFSGGLFGGIFSEGGINFLSGKCQGGAELS